MGGNVIADRGEPVVEHHQRYQSDYLKGTDGWTWEATDTLWHWLNVEWVAKLVTLTLVLTLMAGG